METPDNNPEAFRPHLEDPEHISDAMDAVVAQLVERESIVHGVDWLLDRQKELYQEHCNKRERGEALLPSDESELDDINYGLLTLQELVKKYRDTQE